jgi:hypothetical protein
MPASKYTQEIADEICERISEGEPLREICRDDHTPSWRAVYDWINNNKDFASRIARARELGFDAIAEECLNISDNQEEGVKTVTDHNGTKVETADMIAHRKLKIETRLKLLSKWNPKKYGDKMDVTTDGEKINNVINLGEGKKPE